MPADAFADQVFDATLGYFRILSMYVGLRLGLYEALRDGELTAEALAARAGIDPRYAREWLEQQATAGVLEADVAQDPPAFRLPDDAAESLLDRDSLSYLGATIRQLASLRVVIDPVVEAYRTGTGIAPELFGSESADGQGGSNRPVYLFTLPGEWLPEHRAVPYDAGSWADPGDRHRVRHTGGLRSRSRRRTRRRPSTDTTRTRTRSSRRVGTRTDAGLSDRVRFHAVDGAAIDVKADLAMAFECIHDMPNPVEVLGAARRALAEDGAMLVVDERTRDTFDGTPHELESYFYGWSIFDCLPAGRAASPSAATGTVMRPDTLRRYAEEAGFTRFEILPIEHDAFRLYLLRP